MTRDKDMLSIHGKPKNHIIRHLFDRQQKWFVAACSIDQTATLMLYLQTHLLHSLCELGENYFCHKTCLMSVLLT